VDILMGRTYVYGANKDRNREREIQGVSFSGKIIIKFLSRGYMNTYFYNLLKNDNINSGALMHYE
jgi:hypothetical protein